MFREALVVRSCRVHTSGHFAQSQLASADSNVRVHELPRHIDLKTKKERNTRDAAKVFELLSAAL